MKTPFITYVNTRLITKHLLASFTLILVLSMASCTSNSEPEIDNETASESATEGMYQLTTKQFQSSDMKVGKMTFSTFHEVVKAKGMIDVPPSNRAEVSSYFGGTVKEINLLPGERIAKGQVLFVLENPDYVQVQQDYLEAKGQLMYLRSDYERQKNLAQDSISSQKQFLRAEADYTVASVTVESLRRKLQLMNIDADALNIKNIRTTIPVKSPIAGYITEVLISQGAFLTPSEPAIKIVDTDHIHLELNVFERDLPALAVGQDIRFRIQESKESEYDATVYLINKVIDPEKRTVGIHGHLVDENLAKRLNPGMYVEADIYTTSDKVWSLPKDALVEIDGVFYVLVLQDRTESGYTFLKREVKTGASNDSQIEIMNTADFIENEEFLINGAFNLITE